jgi:hypothetical protein
VTYESARRGSLQALRERSKLYSVDSSVDRKKRRRKGKVDDILTFLSTTTFSPRLSMGWGISRLS